MLPPGGFQRVVDVLPQSAQHRQQSEEKRSRHRNRDRREQNAHVECDNRFLPKRIARQHGNEQLQAAPGQGAPQRSTENGEEPALDK